MVEELKLFKEKHGHADASRKYAGYPKQGRWVNTQRQGYKNYKAGMKQKSQGICEERINKLEKIDFNWTIIQCTTEKATVPDITDTVQDEQEIV